jgi:glycogen synthase
MPQDMEFMDIRKGTDVEFGQSVYEPFGIAQLEPLTFGGICVFSSVCGCAGLLRDISGSEEVKNAIVADYTRLADPDRADIEDLLQIGESVRDRIEANESERVAREIITRLPKNESEIENMIHTGYELAKNMSWDVVAQNYLLSSLQTAPHKLHAR